MELRHQRNSDAYFDMHDETKRNGISKDAVDKIYNIIETMLPQAVSDTELRLVEIFGESKLARRGWVSLTEESFN